MATVDEIWDKIHGWLSQNAPTLNEDFKDGANEENIQKLEDTVGLQLPEDFKASYRIHNGHSSGAIFEEQCFLSVEEIISDWSSLKSVLDSENFNAAFENGAEDPTRKVMDRWWIPEWIPFTTDGCGNAVVIDLAPDKAGTVGQVFSWEPECSESGWLAASFTEYLEKFATDLEAGLYKVSASNENSLEKTQ